MMNGTFPTFRRQICVTFHVFAFTIWLSCSQAENAADEPLRSKKIAFERDATTELPSKAGAIEFGGTYAVRVELDKVPAGAEGVARIRIKNPESFDLPIREVTASCGCTRAELMNDRIPAMGETELVIQIRSPAASTAGVFMGRISLEIDGERVDHKQLKRIDINLHYPISGLLCFRSPLVTINLVDTKPYRLELPFVSSIDTHPNKLLLETTGILEGVPGHVETTSGENRIVLILDSKEATNLGTHGRVLLRDPVSGKADEMTVVVYKNELVTLSPRTLRFAKTAPDSTDYVAHGVIRVKKVSADAGSDSTATQTEELATVTNNIPTQVDAYIDQQKLKMKVQPINKHFFRVQFAVPVIDLETIEGGTEVDRLKSIQWRLISPGVHASGTSAFTVDAS